MAQVLTKPVDPYHAAGPEIIILIISIVLIRVDVPIIPIRIPSDRTPLVMKSIHFEM